MVFDSFNQFEPRIGQLAKRVFDDSHLDSEVRKGKQGGAFCASINPEDTPYVLMNYTGRARDVATLAHELGHAIHAMLASHHSAFTFHSSLPLAETASTFGEMMLTEKLLAEEKDEAVRRDILFKQMDDAFATILRQIYFALLGMVLIFIVAAIDYRYWIALYFPMHLVILLFLVTLTGFGQTVFGAQRWFQVGVLFLQPTEFAKIIAIIVLARYFDATQNQPRDFKWLRGAILWSSGIIGLILLQPNLSNVVVLAVILGSLLWFNGMQIRHLLLFGAIGAAATDGYSPPTRQTPS